MRFVGKQLGLLNFCRLEKKSRRNPKEKPYLIYLAAYRALE